MKILAFLGNPGTKYIRTRHNIGFITGLFFAKENSIRINKKNFLSETGTGNIDGYDLLLLFPQTYMNESGKAVKKAIDYYDTPLSDLIVIHDELELNFGEFKTKFSGGHKGHNGLRSIITETGSPDFHRIRFGIGRPLEPEMSVSDHVLSAFTSDEMVQIEHLMPQVSQTIRSLLKKN